MPPRLTVVIATANDIRRRKACPNEYYIASIRAAQRGYILVFRGTPMSLSQGLAAVLRAIRATKDLAQSDLASAAGRTFLSRIERAKSDVTLSKLDEIALAAGLDTVTLMVLRAVANNGKTPEQILKCVEEELAEFKSLGGLEKLTSQVEDGAVAFRANSRLEKHLAVQECRQFGMTQRETAEKLQLPKSTVADLWKVTN